MKKNVLLFLSVLLITLSSCSKEGCTDIYALNYNADAKSDDGSCIHIYGCTDTRANNYDVNATSSDGSCLFNGTRNFWISNTSKQILEFSGVIGLALYINGELIISKTLDAISFSSEPSCEQTDFSYTVYDITEPFGIKYVSYQVKNAISGDVIWSNNSFPIFSGCNSTQLIYD